MRRRHGIFGEFEDLGYKQSASSPLELYPGHVGKDSGVTRANARIMTRLPLDAPKSSVCGSPQHGRLICFTCNKRHQTSRMTPIIHWKDCADLYILYSLFNCFQLDIYSPVCMKRTAVETTNFLTCPCSTMPWTGKNIINSKPVFQKLWAM